MGEPDARTMWDSVAEAYERQASRAFEAGVAVSEWLCDAAGVSPGMTVLDVGAGPGQTTIVAAERGARVLCTDNSPGMLDIARRLVGDRGLDNVDFKVLDAQEMDLPDDHVDAVVCRYALMLLPDLPAALSEIRRVMRSSGALAFAVWGRGEENVWASLIRDAAIRCGIDVPNPPGPGMFSLADPADAERAVKAAGFTTFESDVITVPMRFDSFDAYWSLRLEASVSTRSFLEPLEDDVRAEVRATAEEIAAPFLGPDGLIFPTVSVAFRAA